ncbi:YbaN family protein [Rheinheimera aquimaris]|uniref:YbaN family protein n=1 Tax=Rheinheimera aquimaris TaxID=412437 RepID=UPI001E47139E|nr:YbaN family protein [Rheinheimera aquimaris]MCD1598166.1 YbaN family protein [Rheinheimera aquimaris]
MWHLTRILLWRALAVVSLLLGLIGIPLPGLPTVPFVLLSAWAAGKGWPALEQRLLTHPKYGPALVQWRSHGIVSRRAKLLASVMMLASAIALQFSAAPFWLKLLLPLFLSVVAVWLWRRPEAIKALPAQQ